MGCFDLSFLLSLAFLGKVKRRLKYKLGRRQVGKESVVCVDVLRCGVALALRGSIRK